MVISYTISLDVTHHLDGRTSSYQTQTVIDFELQGVTQTFPGYGEVRLEASYEWDAKTRTMGAPVISLRHGRNRVIWAHQLPPGQGGAAGGTVPAPTVSGPALPVVEVAERESDDRTGTDQT